MFRQMELIAVIPDNTVKLYIISFTELETLSRQNFLKICPKFTSE